MRRLLIFAVRAALVVAAVGLIRAVLSDRTPERGLQGTRPVVGSLDTWPAVPRRAAPQPGSPD